MFKSCMASRKNVYISLWWAAMLPTLRTTGQEMLTTSCVDIFEFSAFPFSVILCKMSNERNHSLSHKYHRLLIIYDILYFDGFSVSIISYASFQSIFRFCHSMFHLDGNSIILPKFRRKHKYLDSFELNAPKKNISWTKLCMLHYLSLRKFLLFKTVFDVLILHYLYRYEVFWKDKTFETLI